MNLKPPTLDWLPGRHPPPLHACADCEHDLGPIFAAMFQCPLFGKHRHGVVCACDRFKPKTLKRGTKL